jgi:hypothetical protein
MDVLETRTSTDQARSGVMGEALGPAAGRYSDLLPPGQSVHELCDLRLQLRHPGTGLQTLED